MQRNLSLESISERPQFVHTSVKNPKLGIEPNVQYLVNEHRHRNGKLEIAFFVDDVRWYWSTLKNSFLLNGNDWEIG